MPTHGSLTKAGKVRGQTPKIKGRERVSPIARVRNRNNFVKRFDKGGPLVNGSLNVREDDSCNNIPMYSS